MKYCEDCKWCAIDYKDVESSECENESSRLNGLDCVSRKITIFASLARGHYGNCGPEGNLWEAKDAV
jgi:hypothetical protein